MSGNSNHAEIRLARCSHGTYHMCLNGVTVHLSEAQLVGIRRVIDDAARHHATLRRSLLRSDRFAPRDEDHQNN
ncbi:MAG TPA: hypothetical protein P5081_20605 [Phycisphaerae bacterium]|nr:hypothetical protein [Phycisphaerae bacterium]HRW55281.1 hypothetical protein [Phycisphaerae bacterium]